MKGAVVIAATALLGGPPNGGPATRAAADPPATVHHPPRPPARFLKDGAVAVTGFADEAAVDALCLNGEAPQPGVRVRACVFRREDGAAVMILPNPCRYDGFYAHLACHELGHVNGWGPGHGR